VHKNIFINVISSINTVKNICVLWLASNMLEYFHNLLSQSNSHF
jgi:hypothetical protein